MIESSVAELRDGALRRKLCIPPGTGAFGRRDRIVRRRACTASTEEAAAALGGRRHFVSRQARTDRAPYMARTDASFNGLYGDVDFFFVMGLTDTECAWTGFRPSSRDAPSVPSDDPG